MGTDEAPKGAGGGELNMDAQDGQDLSALWRAN